MKTLFRLSCILVIVTSFISCASMKEAFQFPHKVPKKENSTDCLVLVKTVFHDTPRRVHLVFNDGRKDMIVGKKAYRYIPILVPDENVELVEFLRYHTMKDNSSVSYSYSMSSGLSSSHSKRRLEKHTPVGKTLPYSPGEVIVADFGLEHDGAGSMYSLRTFPVSDSDKDEILMRFEKSSSSAKWKD